MSVRREHRWRSYGPTRDRSPWFGGAGLSVGEMRPEYLRRAIRAEKREKVKRGPAQMESNYRVWSLLGEGADRRSK